MSPFVDRPQIRARLRLGYLVPQFPGQTHIFFWREIAALEAMGVDVHLLSTQPPPPGLVAHDWSDTAMGRTTYLASRNPLDAMRSAPYQDWRAALGHMRRDGRQFAKDWAICLPAATRLRDYARAHKLDHIHVHSCARAALIAQMCQRMGGPTYSLTLHGPLSDYGTGQAMKWRDASFATVITRKLMGEIDLALKGALPKDIRLRPMGVDTDVLRRDTPYVPVTEGETLRLFSCARLNQVKGHQDALQAVRYLVDDGVDVHLDIAGEDDAGGSGYRHVLTALRSELGLQDHVTLLGAIDASAVREKLLKAHIFLLASWHEPLGVAYMEAMSCEVPTIGTASGGVPELIESGKTALLVPPKEPRKLATEISELARDPETAQRLSKAGRAHIVANYHSALGAETLVDAIADIKSGPRP